MTRARVQWRRVALIGCLFTLGCASAGATGSGRERPPRMLSRGNPPEIRISGPTTSGRSPVRLTIAVEIDESGRADLSTLKLNGMGSVENRLAIQTWLEQASFRPAERDGMPVRGVFTTSLEARVVVVRISG